MSGTSSDGSEIFIEKFIAFDILVLLNEIIEEPALIVSGLSVFSLSIIFGIF